MNSPGRRRPTTETETETEKPSVTFSGENGNIFNLVAITRRALISAGQRDKAKAILAEVTKAGSYEEAIEILGRYVDFD